MIHLGKNWQENCWIRSSVYQRIRWRRTDIRRSEGRKMKPEWKNIKPAHERLWIWQKANKLHMEICKICFQIPNHEKYILRSQIERSSKSVKDNIAEGNESYYYNDKMKGLFIARKEAGETQSHLRDFEFKRYLPAQKVQEMIDEYEEIKRGINGLIKKIAEKKDTAKNKGAAKI
jgi:four helix bundle protein